MSTTALLVEILIIVFEVTLWLLMIANQVDAGLLDRWFRAASGNVLLQARALVAVAYVLGIMADKTAKWVVEESSVAYLFHFDPVLVGYTAVVSASKDFMSDLLYSRSKVRILRASIFTLPLIIVTAGLGWIHTYPDTLDTGFWPAVLAGVAVPLLAAVAARYLIWLYCTGPGPRQFPSDSLLVAQQKTWRPDRTLGSALSLAWAG